ncbi:MAG: HAD family hydrolase [Gemmatimonadota bacterium]|nr:HAD family hydrolase [Gemmatimonadota bacterium]
MLRGIIFDVDGTLVDSNDAHAESWVEIFSEAGYDVPFDVVRPMIGMGGDKLLPKAIGVEADSDQGKELGRKRWALFKKKYVPTLRPLTDGRALVQRIRNDGLATVIATSAQPEELRVLLRAAEVADLMEEKATSGDAEHSKPDPDIVIAAVKKSGFDRSGLLMLGDTPYDVEAAHRAGVRIIAFRSGGWLDSNLAGASAIYDGPADLLANYDSSPIGLNIR